MFQALVVEIDDDDDDDPLEAATLCLGTPSPNQAFF